MNCILSLFGIVPIVQSRAKPTAPPIGTWVVASFQSEKPLFPHHLPRTSAFALGKDGTYDSEGYFGYGKWTYRSPHLYLIPDPSFGGTLNASFAQDSSTLHARLPKPLAFTFVSGRLRFYEEDRYHLGKRWLNFIPTERPLKISIRKLEKG